MRNRDFLAILVILIILCLSRVGLTAGMNVLPGRLLITDVPVGRLYEVSVPLSIINHGGNEQGYLLSTVRLAAIGAKPEMGYIELPDEQWFYFATKTIIGQSTVPSEFAAINSFVASKKDPQLRLHPYLANGY